MSQRVDIEGVGLVEFPDGMSQTDMAHAIETELLPGLKSGALKLGGGSPAAAGASAPSASPPADQALSYSDRWEQAKAIPGQLTHAANSGLRTINTGIPFSDRMIAGAASLPIIGNGQGYSDNLARERNARAKLLQQHPVLAVTRLALPRLARRCRGCWPS